MNNKPIDFVITWVDGNDKKWQEERKQYDNQSNIDNREVRYREWENLKYWFRGVEKFAPWVNKIYFITYGHVPEWLNLQNDKIVVVKHSEYMPDKYIPTFSSHPIELNIHRIQSLSQNFVYFNDDMFILKDVKEDDFFFHNIPCDSAIMSPIFALDREGFSKIVVNNMSIINNRFNKNDVVKSNFLKWFNIKYKKDLMKNIFLNSWDRFAGFFDFHIPISYHKSTFEKVWENEEEILNNTCLHKFRNVNEDVNHWLMRYWQLAVGNFYPRDVNFSKYLEYSNNNAEIYDWIKKQKSKIVCINDVEGNYRFEEEKQKTIEAFESILPDKSSFEI